MRGALGLSQIMMRVAVSGGPGGVTANDIIEHDSKVAVVRGVVVVRGALGLSQIMMRVAVSGRCLSGVWRS